MKKLLGYSLILVAVATVGMTECVSGYGDKITPAARKASAEGTKIRKELQAAEASVVSKVETGASEEAVEKAQSFLAEKIEAAKKYLNRRKQSFDEMSLTKKLILGALSTAIIVKGIDYRMYGNEGYMASLNNMIYEAMPVTVQGWINSISKTVSEYTPSMETVKGLPGRAYSGFTGLFSSKAPLTK